MTLTLTRGIHTALTITSGGATTLVVDPGAFGFPDSVASADAVLVTHDHFDHVDLPALTVALGNNARLHVFTPTRLDLGAHANRQTLVAEGDEFMVGDMSVRVVALAAPWQNTPQLEKHLRAVTPARVIGLHDGILNDLGRDFGQKTLARIARSYGGDAISLNPGESITLPR